MKKTERTQVVIDDNTIYEIDLDCMECQKADKYKKKGNTKPVDESAIKE